VVADIPVIDVPGIGQVKGALTVSQHFVDLVVPTFNPVGQFTTTALAQVVEVDTVDTAFLTIAQPDHEIQFLCHSAGYVSHIVVAVTESVPVDVAVTERTDIVQANMEFDIEASAQAVRTAQAVQVVMPVGISYTETEVTTFIVMVEPEAVLTGGNLVIANFRPGRSLITDVTGSIYRRLSPGVPVGTSARIVTATTGIVGITDVVTGAPGIVGITDIVTGATGIVGITDIAAAVTVCASTGRIPGLNRLLATGFRSLTGCLTTGSILLFNGLLLTYCGFALFLSGQSLLLCSPALLIGGFTLTIGGLAFLSSTAFLSGAALFSGFAFLGSPTLLSSRFFATLFGLTLFSSRCLATLFSLALFCCRCLTALFSLTLFSSCFTSAFVSLALFVSPGFVGRFGTA